MESYRVSKVCCLKSSSSSSTSPAGRILSPCAACKTLRRRCVDKCLLAPYFPPTQPLKFTIAHRVFGASNLIKFLQELPVEQRADAVNSMVYEATARLRDPIYGCTGTICHLQKKIGELQAELAKAQAQILNVQCQNATLFEQINKLTTLPRNGDDQLGNATLEFHEDNLGFSWEPDQPLQWS